MTVLDDWSLELDQIARTQPGRTPLRPDPVLAEAFADDQHRLPLCRDCDRPMRPGHAPVADFPGTVQEVGAGTCRRCWEHAKRAGTNRTRRPHLPVGTPCKGCERPLRPKRMLLAEAPGTVSNSGRSMCQACYRRSQHVS